MSPDQEHATLELKDKNLYSVVTVLLVNFWMLAVIDHLLS